ncbi:MAG TPA: hypothetical protein VG188_07595 [Solirubrobacteraceae bacterium]|nr:hypothetical protein [Solirubrobacteraceae bacterium]
MLRFLLKRGPVKRLLRGVPLVALLSAAEVATIAKDHLAKLDPSERRRLVALLARARGRPASLSKPEREDLSALVAKLEPRMFVGSAADRLSPMPVPKRLLYGPRRKAAVADERG